MLRVPPFAFFLSGLLLAGCLQERESALPADPFDPFCGPMPACEAAPGLICTVAGTCRSGMGEDGLHAKASALYLPQDMEAGPDGLLYVVDWNNHRIRRIEADGMLETIAGTGFLGSADASSASTLNFNHPTRVAFSPSGEMVISAWHNSKVLGVDLVDGSVRRIAGTGARGFSGDGGPAIDAVLDLPIEAAFDSKARLLIMDQANQRVRRVELDGTIGTVVGKKTWPPDGYSQFCPSHVQDPSENCTLCRYCRSQEDFEMFCTGEAADCVPPVPRGFSGDGGPATEAMLALAFGQSTPAGCLEVGPDDEILVCDTGNHRIRRVSPEGVIQTIAGTGPDHFDPDFPGGFAGDGGPATEALLSRPTDLALAPDGTIYIADTDNYCIRRIDPDGIISTVAGTCGKRGFAGDGGPASEAVLDRPYGVALDAEGNLYVADTHNHRIRKVFAPF